MSRIHTLAITALGWTLFAAGALIAGPGCGVEHGTGAKTTAQEQAVKQAPLKTLLFFMNPAGRPCQMQDEIIGQIRDSLAGCATVRYIKTSNADDRSLFGKYGIRGLPSLIVTDNEGKELHRFTPGIQSGDAILAALKGNKK